MAVFPADLAVIRTEIESHHRLAREYPSSRETWTRSAMALERIRVAAESNSASAGMAEGLAMAAEAAERYGELQQKHADASGPEMPNSAQAFMLQRLTAQKIAKAIRALIPPVEGGETLGLETPLPHAAHGDGPVPKVSCGS